VEHARLTSAAPPPRIHGRVLLAEDGLDNQRLIALLLRKAGAEVMVVDNGQTAVYAALTAQQGKMPFNAILMDMQMPVIDGYEAVRRLRIANYRGPIIALTAHAMTDDRRKCLDAGCDGYLSKPVDRNLLLATVARLMDAQSRSSDGTKQPVSEA
jgi:CheY-like chemotaxis protein